MFDFYNSKLIKREYECREKTDLIDIISTSDGICVTSGNVERVRISYMECPGKHEYELMEQDGKLTLALKNIHSVLWTIHSPFLDNSIRVTVPVNYSGNLELKTSSGRIAVANINAGYLNISSSSGSAKAENITAVNGICISATSGSIKIRKINAKDINASGTSGSININEAESGGVINAGTSSGRISVTDSSAAGDVCLKNSSGTIVLDRVFAGGNVCAGNTSGGVHFTSLKAGGNIAFSSTSGSIKGSIVGRESDYSIASRTTTGMNSLADSSNGSRGLNASTTSGSIKIAFIS